MKPNEIVLSEKSETVKVCIRCRPLNSTETANNNQRVVDIPRERPEVWI